LKEYVHDHIEDAIGCYLCIETSMYLIQRNMPPVRSALSLTIATLHGMITLKAHAGLGSASQSPVISLSTRARQKFRKELRSTKGQRILLKAKHVLVALKRVKTT
jgi:hypothetical protein